MQPNQAKLTDIIQPLRQLLQHDGGKGSENYNKEKYDDARDKLYEAILEFDRVPQSAPTNLPNDVPRVEYKYTIRHEYVEDGVTKIAIIHSNVPITPEDYPVLQK